MTDTSDATTELRSLAARYLTSSRAADAANAEMARLQEQADQAQNDRETSVAALHGAVQHMALELPVVIDCPEGRVLVARDGSVSSVGMV